ncbi:DNA mismatch repair protein MutL [Westerdykella ornata]|uniref:DNA mismatch repair protein PMS1 n=1 Tax=Westerdykella ornata TaxID=318751 RepID=A0A6A6JSV6_WESOR|nr:DNA mismatch repair protein MutL [Westerdykella ornata]KAF2279193.1 DNA mismatch repair protein MutL [Westerdykella ornata]
MATIKPIEGRSIHQIQSGQVIVDLNSVAKELVENALDAGATAIEVRFKNNGLDSIEVQDNGSGIAPEDFDHLALKHYTSKLSSYDDLGSLHTFGFRGEALSSLCALSRFHIITARAADGPKGTKLEFDPSGKLRGTSVVAAKQGTTVVVESLFYNLPVRRKELERTIKREYKKVLNLLHAYACISVGVKFTVSNQIPKGKKTVVFATQSNPNIRENIANVYGAKTLQALIPLDLHFEMNPSKRPGSTQSAPNRSTPADEASRGVRIVGYISRPVHGEGRQNPDRQMFFVNTRPCTLPQVAKAFNEVYKSFNIAQSPFICADIKLDTNAYDVNVSPDKRTILLHDQSALLESLKSELLQLFEAHDQSVPQAQLPDKRLPAFSVSPTRQQESGELGAVECFGMPEHKAADLQSSAEPATSQASLVGILLPGFVKASSLEQFVDRDTGERAGQPFASESRDQTRDCSISSDGENPLFEEARPPGRQPSPSFEPQPESPGDSLPLLRGAEYFKPRFSSQLGKQTSRTTARPGPEAEDIPAVIQTSHKRFSQSTIQYAFDRMRPMRVPSQQATITIGDTTTVATIGSPSRASKTPRVEGWGASSEETQTKLSKRPMLVPSLRHFAAPGTQLGQDEEEQTEEDDGQGGPYLSIPDASTSRPPSPERIEMSQLDIRARSGRSSLQASPSDEQDDVSEEEHEHQVEIEHEGDWGDEYIDDTAKKAREEARIARMIAEAEEAAARPSEMSLKRAQNFLQAPRKSHKTIGLVKDIQTSVSAINRLVSNMEAALSEAGTIPSVVNAPTSTQLNTANPEERLSLTVAKSDFRTMRIIGQFNLGFILAVRPPSAAVATPDLFIIDQHASDEKYNFERFSATTVLVSQRLVHPHPLELTAMEEETILNNEHALTVNGFAVTVDTSGASPVGQRAKLVSLPMSEKVTFTPSDLEELLALLGEHSSSSLTCESRYIPRPSKVRKMLASRACRGSIMIGKTLRKAQMEKVVRHMGEMDKPWSCPHGRPTMRHLFGLDQWQAWEEGNGVAGLGEAGERTDWVGYLRERRRERRGIDSETSDY